MVTNPFPRRPDDLRTDEERAAAAERFSGDPYEQSVIEWPDGSVGWPRGWSVDRKLREIDLARRDGDPNECAKPIQPGSFIERMIDTLRAEGGDDTNAWVETEKMRGDARIEDFRAWKNKEMAKRWTKPFEAVMSAHTDKKYDCEVKKNNFHERNIKPHVPATISNVLFSMERKVPAGDELKPWISGSVVQGQADFKLLKHGNEKIGLRP